jgi:hypothetical protein
MQLNGCPLITYLHTVTHQKYKHEIDAEHLATDKLGLLFIDPSEMCSFIMTNYGTNKCWVKMDENGRGSIIIKLHIGP